MGLLPVLGQANALDGPIERVGLDDLYEMLKNRRRRMVLYYLVHARDGEVTIGELARQLAAWENDIPTAAVASTQRKRTYNTLQQTHLPRLDEIGLVDFDLPRGLVRLEADPRRLEFFLEVLPRARLSWVTWFLVLGTLFWLALLANWLGVHVFHVLSPGSATMILGTSFLALLSAHGYLLYRFFHPAKRLF